MPLSPPLLDLRQVQAGYGQSQVLFGVNLEVREGEIVTLLGRNGMGKTTCVRSLMGLHPLRGGEVHFGGERLDGLPPFTAARRGLGLVPEGRQVFPNLSVAEHLSAFHVAAPAWAAQAAQRWTPERVCELFPRLGERAHHMGNQLSGGEQQMLAIGRALVTNLRLLVLDEATEGLSPLVREEIWRALRQLRTAGQAMLVIDKHVRRLIALADRHVILEKGHVVWQGTSEQLDADHALWARYVGV